MLSNFDLSSHVSSRNYLTWIVSEGLYNFVNFQTALYISTLIFILWKDTKINFFQFSKETFLKIKKILLLFFETDKKFCETMYLCVKHLFLLIILGECHIEVNYINSVACYKDFNGASVIQISCKEVWLLSIHQLDFTFTRSDRSHPQVCLYI